MSHERDRNRNYLLRRGPRIFDLRYDRHVSSDKSAVMTAIVLTPVLDRTELIAV